MEEFPPPVRRELNHFPQRFKNTSCMHGALSARLRGVAIETGLLPCSAQLTAKDQVLPSSAQLRDTETVERLSVRLPRRDKRCSGPTL